MFIRNLHFVLHGPTTHSLDINSQFRKYRLLPLPVVPAKHTENSLTKKLTLDLPALFLEVENSLR